MAATQGGIEHGNCDHFSIYISQLASELTFKPPTHQRRD